MKRVFMGLVVLAALVWSTEGYSQCKITDANGREIRSADCFGALLRVETDKFIYALIEPEGFVQHEHQQIHLYFTQPFCQGEPNMYSPARSQGYFFEPVQYVDDSNFYYPQFKAVAVGGSAIRSYWDSYNCYDDAGVGWWDDRTVFAPLAAKPRSHFAIYKLPFKIARIAID